MKIDKLIDMVSVTNGKWNFGDTMDEIMLTVTCCVHEFGERLSKFHKKVQTIIWVILLISSLIGLYLFLTRYNTNIVTTNDIIFRIVITVVQVITLSIGIFEEIFFRKMFVNYISEMMVSILTIFYQYNKYIKKADKDSESARMFDGITVMYNDLMSKYIK